MQASQNQFDAANRQAQLQMGSALGRMGMGGEPAANILSNMNLENQAAQHQMLAQFLAPIFQQAMATGAGLPQVGAGGIANAGMNMQQMPQVLDTNLAGLGSLGGALGQLLELHRTGQLAPLLQQMAGMFNHQPAPKA
jgi:hypothetical protein